MHGSGDGAAVWQITLWRFESNGWPAERLYTVNVPYPAARDDDSKAQPGRTSVADNVSALQAVVDQARKASGAQKVILIANSRGGNTVRTYIAGAGADQVSVAILGGTPSHGVWAVKGVREGSEFSGTGPYLSALNARKNAAGDEVTGPVRWMTLRSDGNDKFAQPDGVWIGMKGMATNIDANGPALKGATNLILPGVDHRETSFSRQAFATDWRFITGSDPAADIVSQPAPRLSGKITGLGRDPKDAKSGDYSNNLALAGATLTLFATDPATGARKGAAVYQTTTGSSGDWGPVTAQPGVPYEFVISAPGYATTHIYRSSFARSSALINLRPERIAEADKTAGAIVILSRPRGYFDLQRDQISLDGKAPPGVPPVGAGVSSAKLLLPGGPERAVAGEFNRERLTGRSYRAAEGHVVVLELTY
jgi:hypothetical protein